MRLAVLAVVAVLLVPGTALAVELSSFSIGTSGAVGDLCGELEKAEGERSTDALLMCLGYIYGVVDMVSMIRQTTDGDLSSVTFCRPKEVGAKQLGVIVAKWVREHPERRHESPLLGTISALRKAFPCSD